MDGERVTTGSEPNEDGYDGEICCDCDRSVVRCTGSWWTAADELWARAVDDGTTILCPPCFTERARLKGIHVYWVPAVDGEPGHDEQTEEHDADLLRRAARVLNDNYLAGSQGARWDQLEESEQEYWITAVQAVLVAALDSDAKGCEWQPDPRTVAAVVEALREARHNARTGTQADAFSRAAIFIEERFKPSAPGGDTGPVA